MNQLPVPYRPAQPARVVARARLVLADVAESGWGTLLGLALVAAATAAALTVIAIHTWS